MESRNCTRLDLVCCSETRGLDGLWLVTVTTAGDTLPFDLNHTRLFSPFNSDVFFFSWNLSYGPTARVHVSLPLVCSKEMVRGWSMTIGSRIQGSRSCQLDIGGSALRCWILITDGDSWDHHNSHQHAGTELRNNWFVVGRHVKHVKG